MQGRRCNQWKSIYVVGKERILNIYELDENERLKIKFKRNKHRNLKILNEKLSAKNAPCLNEDPNRPNETSFQSPGEILSPPASNTPSTSNQSISIEDSSIDTLSNESLPIYSSNPNALDGDTPIDFQNSSLPPENPPDENNIQKDKNKSNRLFSLSIENYRDYDINSENDDFFLYHFEH